MVTVSRSGIAMRPEAAFEWFRRARVHGTSERVEGRLTMKSWLNTPKGRLPISFEFVPDRHGTRVVAHARDRVDGATRSFVARELQREVWRMQRDIEAAERAARDAKARNAPRSVPRNPLRP